MGDPTSKLRHRTFVRGGRSITFDPQYKEKKAVSREILAMTGRTNFRTPMKAYLIFMFPIASSCKNPWNLVKDDKPDLDNLEKFYLDCANEIIWHDDCQIVKLRSSKNYSLNPRTEIYFMPIETHDLPTECEKVLDLFPPQEMEQMLLDMEKITQHVGTTTVNTVIEMMPSEEKTMWLISLANMVKEFSIRYNSKFNKVNKL